MPPSIKCLPGHVGSPRGTAMITGSGLPSLSQGNRGCSGIKGVGDEKNVEETCFQNCFHCNKRNFQKLKGLFRGQDGCFKGGVFTQQQRKLLW